jgi:hypothetical protein
MLVKVILVDVNPKMVAAWRETFEANPEVDIVHGSMLAQEATAWVSPTNSRGSMDGGLDAIIKTFLGGKIEQTLQKEISPAFTMVCSPSASRPAFPRTLRCRVT